MLHISLFFFKIWRHGDSIGEQSTGRFCAKVAILQERKLYFPGHHWGLLESSSNTAIWTMSLQKKNNKKKIYHVYTVFQGSLCCVSLGFYCKDHLAASMSQIPVLPTVASGKVKFPFPLLTKSKPKPTGRRGGAPRQKGWQVHKNLEEEQPGRSCKRRRDTPCLRFSLSNTHDPAYATHGNLPSLKSICLYSSLNIIYNYTRCRVSLLWVFALLWVQVGTILRGEEELPPGHPSWVPHGLLGSTWKYRYMTSKGFQFRYTKPTKAQNYPVLNYCCVILFKAEVLSLTLLSCRSSISLLSAQGISQDSP